MLGFSSSQLTNSIIFQRGFSPAHQPDEALYTMGLPAGINHLPAGGPAQAPSVKSLLVGQRWILGEFYMFFFEEIFTDVTWYDMIL